MSEKLKTWTLGVLLKGFEGWALRPGNDLKAAAALTRALDVITTPPLAK